MRFSTRPKVRIALSLLTLLTIMSALTFVVLREPATSAHAAGLGVSRLTKNMHIKDIGVGNQAPSDANCVAKGYHCYSPQQIRNAYGIAPLINNGYTGKGQTIVIIDSYGSPTAYQDLQAFDAAYSLPDPPSFQQLAPIGSVPFDPTSADQLGWAEETSLDIQWSHAMAPAANIVVLTSPVSETQGVQGLPEFLKLEQYALDHHLGKIISQSWGTTENTLFTPAGKKVLTAFQNFYERAVDSHVTVFASSGDAGTGNPDVNGNTYPFPTVGFPASSPLVTAVGGTTLNADLTGNYQSETTWNDGVGSATGGGISQYFKEPNYQKDNLSKANQQLLNGHRAIPDISYNADPNSGVPVYLGFLPQRQPRFYIFGGTSAGSPQWAGIIADANQSAGHSLGFLNTALYRIGNSKASAYSYNDITVGNNAQLPIAGYNATPGWDAATGWGTPKTVGLVLNLIKMLKN